MEAENLQTLYAAWRKTVAAAKTLGGSAVAVHSTIAPVWPEMPTEASEVLTDLAHWIKRNEGGKSACIQPDGHGIFTALAKAVRPVKGGVDINQRRAERLMGEPYWEWGQTLKNMIEGITAIGAYGQNANIDSVFEFVWHKANHETPRPWQNIAPPHGFPTGFATEFFSNTPRSQD